MPTFAQKSIETSTSLAKIVPFHCLKERSENLRKSTLAILYKIKLIVVQ